MGVGVFDVLRASACVQSNLVGGGGWGVLVRKGVMERERERDRSSSQTRVFEKIGLFAHTTTQSWRGENMQALVAVNGRRGGGGMCGCGLGILFSFSFHVLLRQFLDPSLELEGNAGFREKEIYIVRSSAQSRRVPVALAIE